MWIRTVGTIGESVGAESVGDVDRSASIEAGTDRAVIRGVVGPPTVATIRDAGTNAASGEHGQQGYCESRTNRHD